MSEKRSPSVKKPVKPAGKPAPQATGKPAPQSVSSPIDFSLLAQIVELMSKNDLNTVDVRDGDRRVILKRGAAGSTIQMVQAPTPLPQVTNPGGPAQSGTAQTTVSAGEDESKYHRITSPMVGTFYAAAKPGEKPFIAVGATVNSDSDVCIIEAMKTFNNIKAECNGTVARILVQDGHPVEFGTVLFLVKPN